MNGFTNGNGTKKSYPNGHVNGHVNGRMNGASEYHTNGHLNGDPNGFKNAKSPSVPMDVPVAICGMAMRLPGGIRNDDALYDFLIKKRDARSPVPKDRYNVEAYHNPHGKHGTVITKHGYFLDDVDLAQFDPSTFSIAAAEAEQLDPNQRLALEVVREALERAGEPNWRGKPIGTYVGLFTEDWQDMRHKDSNFHHAYQLLGTLDFALANRISYEYDLRGPSVMYKTACSSAGMGLHEALQAIRQGSITAAVVVGANLIMAPGMTVSMSLLMALSPEGSSKSFDAAADGYARGDAVSALYIKRLDEAIRDGNPIRAVIRASACNADGKTPGISLPSLDAHESVIREAYASAGLDFATTAMVEAHGTGTPAGDPIEANAIAKCFGNNGVYLGSVKPNLGHSEGAAVITSIMKAVMSLEHKTIIPNIKFDTPNPEIPWDKAKLVVPLEPCPWPEGRAERLSVNSYGIGGTNVHFILDSAASFGLQALNTIPRAIVPAKKTKTLLLFSAGHPEALKATARNHQEYIAKFPDRLDDVSYTLAERREHLKYRTFSVTDGTTAFKEPVAMLCQNLDKVAFVFTGQGAQWAHMGRKLAADYPSFLTNIQSLDAILQTVEEAPSWSIEDIIFLADDTKKLSQAEYAQPICTALQIALVDLLASWGVVPHAVVGHSSGEIAAAYAAGSLTKRDAIIIAFYRGHVCKKPRKMGSMAAIGLGKADVLPFILPGVEIACENSASSTTLSGDSDALDKVLASFKETKPDAFARKLQVEIAYHSDHMRLVGETYQHLLSKHVDPRSPKVPFYSSVYGGKVLTKAIDFGPLYWQRNLENPVLFHTAVKAMLEDSLELIHLEVGPHSTLRGPLRQIYQETKTSVQYVSTLSRGEDDTETLLSAIGQLYVAGLHVQIPSEGRSFSVLNDLPTYPWHYERKFWSETRIMKNWRFRKHGPHDILGLRTLDGTDLAPTWRSEIRVVDVPWLKDHCVGNDIVFPAAAYMTMAGEAVYQLGNSTRRDYTVRDVEFRQALVLHEDHAIELMTTLRPQRLTGNLDSEWFEFHIVSYDGQGWNKHCSGLVRCGPASFGRASKLVPSSPEPLPRTVSSTRWYTTMARVGIIYGPRFTGLENITAGITERSAVANITDFPGDEGIESFYPLHPATLDMMLQSWTVAAFQGEYRTFKQPFLPTFVEELYVGMGTGEKIRLKTTTSGRNVSAGRLHAQGESYGITSDGELAFSLKGFRGTRMEPDDEPHELMALQLQWKPDFNFLDAAKLTRPIYDFQAQLSLTEKLYVLCAIESYQAIQGQGVTATQPHFERYRRWMSTQVLRFETDGYPLVAESPDLVKLSSEDRKNLIFQVLEQCKEAGCGAMATATWRTYDQLVNIFEGKTDFLDLLIHDGTLAGIYNWMNDIWDVGPFFRLLGHTQPQMRILEIGAGTGGLTAKILKHLRSDFGDRLYLRYTFTDISSGFFVAAQERFQEYDGIEYKVLDISRDPLEQGFHPGDYDLIIASNVLHATPILHETLSNVRTLLDSQGRLFLQELSPITSGMVYIMGLFSGWWLGEADGRTEGPFISPEEWDIKLRAAGFGGCDSVTFDNERPYHVNANIIARPAISFEYPKKLSLLSGASRIHPLALKVETLLREKGYKPEHYQWGQHERPVDGEDIVSFIDLDAPLLHGPNNSDWARFIDTIKSSQESSLLWLMQPAQIQAKNPHAALILGMARTIRSELAMTLATLELEHTDTTEAASAVVNVFERVQRDKDDDDVGTLDPDMEFVWTDGQVNVGRFHWYPVSGALRESAMLLNNDKYSKSLAMHRRGLLQTLHWSGGLLPDLPTDHVQVEIKAVGLNFTDVLIAMGVVHGTDALGNGFDAFGQDGAGVVSKVGADVDHVKIGDRVIVLGMDSVGLATQVQRHGMFTLRIPDALSFEDAATMPAVYVTVLLGLVDKARLEKGQSILIHAAAGGVGIAAIHVARWIGADIYCTVGSEEKAKFLVDELGVPRDRIFHSRDTSFKDDLMAATDGVGVDCVLNQVSGELLHATWECVAASGCMVEIGKRDMAGRAMLALDRFEDNRTFCGIDVSREVAFRKPAGGRIMRLLLDLYADGHIKPIRPMTLFKAEDIQSAIRFMQQGTHMGKIVIQFPETADALPSTPAIPKPTFRGDRAYLLAGGMGGLGRAIAVWMVTHGAKYIIFLSRSAGKSVEDQELVHELNLMGCSVQAVAGDVADSRVVNSAIKAAPVPIAGVMQMAMVLRDIGIMDMDLETYDAVIRPRIDGTWNLHNGLLDADLDFFVLFSSICGIVGYYGQANYAASNSFLDAFVQYRHAQHLAASVMDIGAIGDVGYISRTPSAKENMEAMAGRLYSEQDFLDTLQLTIARSLPDVKDPGARGRGYQNAFQSSSQITQALECRLPIMDPQNNIIWKRDPRMAIYRNIETVSSDNTAAASGMKPFLSTMQADPQQLDRPAATNFLAGEVRDRVAMFLMRQDDEEPLDLELTLSAAGVDSLVAIELRNWWKQNLGVDVSVLELMNGGSMQRLGELAAKRLKEKLDKTR